MIKIIITATLLLGTTLLHAQKKDEPVKTREQIISKEDPHNPLVNGIPYNQYKAQVEVAAKQTASVEAQVKRDNEASNKQHTDMKLPPHPAIEDKKKK